MQYRYGDDLVFLSTPSSQRATYAMRTGRSCRLYFYPRPLRRGRPSACSQICSSHNFYPRPLRRGRRSSSARTRRSVTDFYPRPLRRGRLALFVNRGRIKDISIHALFAEGDLALFSYISGLQISIHALFAEGDRHAARADRQGQISIHALFAEGDCPARCRRRR